MNRLVSTQLAVEAQHDKRVLVVTHTREIRDAMHDMAAAIPAGDVIRIHRAHGAAGIDYRDGGRVRFVDPRHGPPGRGLTADLVYVDTPYGDDPRVMADVTPCVATTGGEVIRA